MENKKVIEVLEKDIAEMQDKIKWYEQYIEQNNKRPNEYNLKANRKYRQSIKNLKEYIKAYNHAINCVGAIVQIRAERDIAIQQLNELGYQFGEKVWYNMLEDKPKEDEDVLVQLDDFYYIAHYKGVVYATDETETEIWEFEDFEYTNEELEDFYKIHRWRKIRSDE